MLFPAAASSAPAGLWTVVYHELLSVSLVLCFGMYFLVMDLDNSYWEPQDVLEGESEPLPPFVPAYTRVISRLLAFLLLPHTH